jgi:ribosomal protein L40E
LDNIFAAVLGEKKGAFREGLKMESDRIFCNKCGAENEKSSKFCKKCGAALYYVSQLNKPSIAWYLLPILLGILGGIIGYFVIRSKDVKMAKNMLYVGLGIFVLGIVLIAAMPSPPPVDTGVPEFSPSSPSPTPIATSSLTSTPTPVPTSTPSPTSQLTETEQQCRDGLIEMRDSFIEVKNEHGRVLDETSTLEYCDIIWQLFAMSNGKCKQEALEALNTLKDASMYPSWVDIQIFNVEHSEF